jgi:hypothetical protein
MQDTRLILIHDECHHVNPERETGYGIYMCNRPITTCSTLQAARGWLLAQWEEGAAEAAEWNVRHTQLHPRHLSDDDVVGILRQAEDIAEAADAEERRRGY